MLLDHQILVQVAGAIGFGIATNLGNRVRLNDLPEAILSDTCESLQRREGYFKDPIPPNLFAHI
jgi:hypothetical protein